ncbi:hypothetical protein BaRGS_00026605 [Batillaria attramentaria]|uniref:Uncharacterized protein n=1 Tax=Batillaria attramentaria TaxID=370345 RepID=A0ABD0K5E8_9CAEN
MSASEEQLMKSPTGKQTELLEVSTTSFSHYNMVVLLFKFMTCNGHTNVIVQGVQEYFCVETVAHYELSAELGPDLYSTTCLELPPCMVEPV